MITDEERTEEYIEGMERRILIRAMDGLRQKTYLLKKMLSTDSVGTWDRGDWIVVKTGQDETDIY